MVQLPSHETLRPRESKNPEEDIIMEKHVFGQYLESEEPGK